MAVNPTVLEIKAKISGLKGLNQLKSSLRKLGTESVNAENTLKGYTAEITKFAQKTGNSINSLEAQKKAFEALRRSVDVTGDEFKQAGIELEKLDKGAVQTNLGCEGEFSYADNDIRKTGGAVSLTTISNRHVIARNKFYTKERWTALSKKEKREQWHWAKNSKEAKKVREMEAEFLRRVEGINKLCIEGKVQKKKKQDQQIVEALVICKKHGGPLTPNGN